MKKKKKEEKPKLFVFYSQTESGGGIVEGQEDTDWPEYDPVYREHKLEGISLEPRKQVSWANCDDAVEVDFKPHYGNEVWLVRVIYDSGSTFGRSFGHVAFVGIYQDEDKADSIAKSIRNDFYEGYKPWEGYFERLDHIEVTRHVIGDVEISKRY